MSLKRSQPLHPGTIKIWPDLTVHQRFQNENMSQDKSCTFKWFILYCLTGMREANSAELVGPLPVPLNGRETNKTLRLETRMMHRHAWVKVHECTEISVAVCLQKHANMQRSVNVCVCLCVCVLMSMLRHTDMEMCKYEHLDIWVWVSVHTCVCMSFSTCVLLCAQGYENKSICVCMCMCVTGM